MLAGRRSPACKACWTMEDAGIKSDRQLKNESLDHYLDTDITVLLDMCHQGKNYLAHYKIDSSNTCNSTCVTCSSTFSSAWTDLERKHGQATKKNWQLKPENFRNQIDFAQAKSIGFRGGEPLLSPYNFDLLEQLIAHGNTTCFINFTTNGSVELTAKQKKILEHFDNVNMCMSIDGVGPVFEYLRYPLQWNQLLNNLDYFRNNGMMLSVSYTLSNLNILYHDQTCAWFEQQGLLYHVNPVTMPACFRPGALPKKIKQHLANSRSGTVISHLLHSHTPEDDADFASFQQEIAKQDQWKGIRMQDYLPELCQLLD